MHTTDIEVSTLLKVVVFLVDFAIIIPSILTVGNSDLMGAVFALHLSLASRVSYLTGLYPLDEPNLWLQELNLNLLRVGGALSLS